MKNICIVILSFLTLGSTFAQSVDANKTTNDLKRKLAIDTEAFEQFREQLQSFETAIASGKKEEMAATKLMIQQTMLRKIQQGQKESRKKNNGPDQRDLSQEEKGKRVELRKKYLEEKAVSKKYKTELSDASKSKNNAATSTNTRDNSLAQQQSLYDRFSAVKKISSPIDGAKLHKLTLSFHDILNEDLKQLKATLTD